MTENELAVAVFAATDVLRVEALPTFAVASDDDWFARYLTRAAKPDVEMKRPWLDRITQAAQRGRPWRRLRVIHNPVSEYERFQIEWSYPDNVDAGEVVKVVDAAAWSEGARSGMWVGDTYFLDGRVIELRYDHDGAFIRADDTGDQEKATIAASVWAFAYDFTGWWDSRADLHRAVSA